MKKTVLRFGLISALVILVLSCIQFFLLPGLDMGTQEVIGYLTIVLSMVFVFAGIKYFRDRVNGGNLAFGQGLKIGTLIVLIPAVTFGLFDLLYTEVINPGFMDEYYNQYIEQVRKDTPPEELDAKLASLQKQKEFFGQPLMQFLVMTATVFIIGFIVTIISALALRRKRKMASYA